MRASLAHSALTSCSLVITRSPLFSDCCRRVADAFDGLANFLFRIPSSWSEHSNSAGSVLSLNGSPVAAFLLGTGELIRVFRGCVHVTTSMETAWLAYRQEGPRKANTKYKRRLRQPWTEKQVKQLRSLAKANTPTGVISLKMERAPGSIASKAQREEISLKPINRSSNNRRKKTAKRG